MNRRTNTVASSKRAWNKMQQAENREAKGRWRCAFRRRPKVQARMHDHTLHPRKSKVPRNISRRKKRRSRNSAASSIVLFLGIRGYDPGNPTSGMAERNGSDSMSGVSTFSGLRLERFTGITQADITTLAAIWEELVEVQYTRLRRFLSAFSPIARLLFRSQYR